MAGQNDHDLQQLCTGQALLNNAKNINHLVKFCNAYENKKLDQPTTVAAPKPMHHYNETEATTGKLKQQHPEAIQPPPVLQQQPLDDQQSKESVPKLKVSLVDRTRASFDICETQPLPVMNGSPPLKLLTQAQAASKKDVTPNSRSRWTTSPAPPLPTIPPIDHLNIANMKADYCFPTLGYRDLLASHGHMVQPKSQSKEHQEAGDLQDLVANLNLPSMESLENRSDIIPTIASLVALLPADHLAAWKALTPINIADPNVTAITWPRPVETTKASPIHLPEEKKDWFEELTPYLPYRCHITETEGVIRSDDRTVTPANLRQEALNTLHAGHVAATTMLTKATQEVIDVKAATRIVKGNFGPQGTLNTDRSAQALLEHRTTPDSLHGLSPARIIFSNELKSSLPAEYQP